jgi:hypothetical protein
MRVGGCIWKIAFSQIKEVCSLSFLLEVLLTYRSFREYRWAEDESPSRAIASEISIFGAKWPAKHPFRSHQHQGLPRVEAEAPSVQQMATSGSPSRHGRTVKSVCSWWYVNSSFSWVLLLLDAQGRVFRKYCCNRKHSIQIPLASQTNAQQMDRHTA